MLKLMSAFAFSAALMLGFAPPSSVLDAQELAQAEDEMMDDSSSDDDPMLESEEGDAGEEY
jgi:hypothetical protein